MSWRPTDVPDLSGKVVLVTGANSGIGFEAAQLFASKGARVVLACRDAQRGAAAVDRIRGAGAPGGVELLQLDLASLSDVRRAAVEFTAAYPALDVLCNNAGVMAVPRALTADGFELQLGVNHLGHFALTGLLLERLLAAGGARVVNVSSTAHRIGHLRFQDLDGAKSYHKWAAYGQSKLANLLFTFELQQRLRASGARAISVACHPGYAATDLQLVGPRLTKSRASALFFRMSNAVFAQSAARGAWPTVYAATAPDVQGGDYIGPGGLGEIAGAPRKVQPSKAALDETAARWLWEISVQRTSVDFAQLG
jgi:NAD(P)-dependent dehydrogenase (short-subunit alcohol dehydrogenase family)